MGLAKERILPEVEHPEIIKRSIQCARLEAPQPCFVPEMGKKRNPKQVFQISESLIGSAKWRPTRFRDY